MPVSAVHEKMHEWTGEQWQPNDKTPEVSAMLGHQIGRGNDDESEQCQPHGRGQEVTLPFILMFGVIMN
jgi:hypothetical protein